MAVEWTRLVLDVAAFDPAPFLPYVGRSRAAGICFTTMAALDDGPTQRRALYELNRTCSADIPGRGTFYSYEEYEQQRLTAPGYDPGAVLLALDGERWVGMAATSLRREEGYAFSEMTGVVADHRGRGLSLALKVLAVDVVRSAGLTLLRTYHHPGNTAAIAMNRRLGFVDDLSPVRG